MLILDQSSDIFKHIPLTTFLSKIDTYVKIPLFGTRSIDSMYIILSLNWY